MQKKEALSKLSRQTPTQCIRSVCNRNTTAIPVQSSNPTAKTAQIIANSTPHHRLKQPEIGKRVRSRDATSGRHQNGNSPRLQGSTETRRRRDTGPTKASYRIAVPKEKTEGKWGTENPRSSGGGAGLPAQVRKPWISEATSGSRPPAPPAMVAPCCCCCFHTLPLSPPALRVVCRSHGGEGDEGGGRRLLENREKSRKGFGFFFHTKKVQTVYITM